MHPVFDPKNRPALMAASASLALAIGLIIYQATKNMVLSVSVGVFLVVADYLALKMFTKGNDK